MDDLEGHWRDAHDRFDGGDRSTAQPIPDRDFSKVFAGDLDDLLRTSFDAALCAAADYAAAYQGRVRELAAAELAEAFAAEERIDALFDRGATPARLLNAADLRSPAGIAADRTADDASARIAEKTAFFDAELAALGAARLDELAGAPELAPWRQMLLDLAASSRHMLSPAEEQILGALDPDAAWGRAYDREIGRLTFEFRGRTLSDDEIYPLLEDPDISVRRDARASRIAAFAAHRDRFAAIFDEIVRLAGVSSRLRGFDRPEGPSLIESGLDATALDALMAAADSRVHIAHRWTAAKLEALGIPAPSDIAAFHARVPGAEIEYSWDEALGIVAEGWRRACPTLAPRMERLLESGIIDARPRPGKMPGAFCFSDTRNRTPYVHMSWNGGPEDLLTLAHEMGHALHAELVHDTQRPLMLEPGRLMAETASTFSEGIVFDVMLERAASAAARRGLVGHMLETRINTILLQIAFHKFERRIHDARSHDIGVPDGKSRDAVLSGIVDTGPLHADFLEQAMLAAESWCHGPAIVPDSGAAWPRIWHFFRAPFYVWTYAAADTVSSALLTRRREDGFEPRFEALLRTGASASPASQLAPFGIDLASPQFWQTGFDTMENLLDRFAGAR